MYNNAYTNMYNPNNYPVLPTKQDNLAMIDEQMNRLQQMKNQINQQQNQQTQQPTSINQTFQLAPTHSTMKFVNTINDVAKDVVFGDTPFFSKDMSMLWVKNLKGDIKSFELKEIVPKDDKDIQIELLTAKIEELERKMNDESITSNVISTKNDTNTTNDDESIDTTIETSKPSSISKVSRSKTK